MVDIKRKYTKQEAQDLRRSHEQTKEILSHSYSQSVIEAGEKQWEVDYLRIINGETTLAELETEALSKWDKKIALACQIDRQQEIFNDALSLFKLMNKEHKFYERHQSCVEDAHKRLMRLKCKYIELVWSTTRLSTENH